MWQRRCPRCDEALQVAYQQADGQQLETRYLCSRDGGWFEFDGSRLVELDDARRKPAREGTGQPTEGRIIDLREPTTQAAPQVMRAER